VDPENAPVNVRALALLLSIACIGLAPASEAQAEVRGRAFEIGGLGGVIPFQAKVALEPCPWFGAFIGHRFEGIDRLHLGVRAGWEGCVGEQTFTGDRIDFILIDFGFIYGVRVTDFLFGYGIIGAGFALIDAVPSGGVTHPRVVFQTGGGAQFILGKHFLIDASVKVLVFENVQLGGFGGQAGSTASPLFTVAFGAQI
jgi:hypothetical protein